MEYQFVTDIDGQTRVRMSMGHEVVGHWFNEELSADGSLLEQVTAATTELTGTMRQWQCVGKEYTLLLSDEEVIIQANHLAIGDEELEEGMNYYDKESFAACGKEDFIALVSAYRNFTQGN